MADRNKNRPGLLCRLGFHPWLLTRPVDALDSFPPPWIRRRNPQRRCHCGAAESWLPEYGGSEIGCWMPDDPNKLPSLADFMPTLGGTLLMASVVLLLLKIG